MGQAGDCQGGGRELAAKRLFEGFDTKCVQALIGFAGSDGQPLVQGFAYPQVEFARIRLVYGLGRERVAIDFLDLAITMP